MTTLKAPAYPLLRALPAPSQPVTPARITSDHQTLPALVNPRPVRLRTDLAVEHLTDLTDGLEALVVPLVMSSYVLNSVLDGSFALFVPLVVWRMIQVGDVSRLLDQTLFISLVASAILPRNAAEVAELPLAQATVGLVSGRHII